MPAPLQVRGTLVLLAVMVLARAVAAPGDRVAEMRKRWALEGHAYRLRPAPPLGVLRSDNINDIEVREIQAAAKDFLPKAIVNIAGVTVGCPCEDGPKCSDQVWVVGWEPDHTTGLLFSRIDGKWILGPVQKWWLDYEELLHRMAKQSQIDFQMAEDRLFERMPKCTGEKR
jgi:hypothetical protein